MPFQKITPKFINKIFILGEINDHFIQIACCIISLYWITQVWVHFVSFMLNNKDITKQQTLNLGEQVIMRIAHIEK